MYVQFLPAALMLAGLAAAVVAGVFLTFSDFVMRSLAAAAPSAGAEAMQQVNRKVYRSVFMALFVGSAVVAATILLMTVAVDTSMATGWLIVGSATYLVCVFGVTGLHNVPMNTKLDGVDPRSAAGQAYWTTYYRRWTTWNHIRVAGSIVAAGSYTMAAFALARSV